MIANYVLEIMYVDEEMYFAPTGQEGQSGRYMCDFVLSRGAHVHYSKELGPRRLSIRYRRRAPKAYSQAVPSSEYVAGPSEPFVMEISLSSSQIASL